MLYTLSGFATGLLRLALRGDLLVVGAPRAAVDGQVSAGSVSAYVASTGALLWTAESPTPEVFGEFGRSIAILGDRVYVGEPGADDDGLDQGQAHVLHAQTGALVSSFGPPASDPGGGVVGAENLGVAMDAPDGWLAVSSGHDAPPALDVGRVYVYEVAQPKLRVLCIGIEDGGLFVPLRGDLGAELVADAFRDEIGVPEEDLELITLSYGAGEPSPGEHNFVAIRDAVAEWGTRVAPGDTFAFYVATHGAYLPHGDELAVCAQTSLVTFSCAENTGDEILLLSPD